MAAALVSCDKFLDQMPDNRTELDSEAKITALLTSAYPETCFIMATELISDNVDDYRVSYTQTDRFADELFAWKDVTESDNESPENIWQSAYSAIAAANEALRAIDNLGCNTKTLREAKAEALLCRAYNHFILVNLFCWQYNSETSDSDMGIPYMEAPETLLRPSYSRETVASVYEKINRDIEEALPLQGDSYFTVPKYHFNKTAAYAFAEERNEKLLFALYCPLLNADDIRTGSTIRQLRAFVADSAYVIANSELEFENNVRPTSPPAVGDAQLGPADFLYAALDALDGLEPAVAEDVRRLRAPRRDRALAGRHEEVRVIAVPLGVEKRRRALQLLDVERLSVRLDGIHPLRVDVDRTERRIELRDRVLQGVHAERRIGIRTKQKYHRFTP